MAHQFPIAATAINVSAVAREETQRYVDVSFLLICDWGLWRALVYKSKNEE